MFSLPPALEAVLQGSPVALVLAFGWLMAERRANKERAMTETLSRELVESSVKMESLASKIIAIGGGRKAEAET